MKLNLRLFLGYGVVLLALIIHLHLPDQVAVAEGAARNDIQLGHQTLIKNPKTRCNYIFRDLGSFVVYCPKNVVAVDMVEDFLRVARTLSFPPLKSFDVFNDLKHTPRTSAEDLKLPDEFKFESFIIQILDGKIFDKHCLNVGKEVPCDF